MNGFTPSRRIEPLDGNYIVYVRPPRIIGEYPEQYVMLSSEQYQRYMLWREGGVMIQDALSDLTPSQREILMTGLNDTDFAKIADDRD